MKPRYEEKLSVTNRICMTFCMSEACALGLHLIHPLLPPDPVCNRFMSRLMLFYPSVSFSSLPASTFGLLLNFDAQIASLPASTFGLLLNFNAQIAIAFVSFYAIRMLNSAVRRCVNYINRYATLFSLIKNRTKPDRNGRLAEAGTPKRAMKTTTL